jgi:hypothetical protein
MKNIVDLSDFLGTTLETLRASDVGTLALLAGAPRLDGLELKANGVTAAIHRSEAGDYGVTMDGVRLDRGILDTTSTTGYLVTVDGAQMSMGVVAVLLASVKRLVAELELPQLKPTPTAHFYRQFGFWADVQEGRFMHYPTYTRGGWDAEPIEVEYACSHMLERVNKDFGTDFDMDDFEEGDCDGVH